MYGISHTQKIPYAAHLLRQRWAVYYAAVFFSFLLSYVASYRVAVINPDAICYVQSAAAMKMGLNTAMHLCGQAKWPFFSLLIYSLVQLSHLSYVNAAFLLDSFFSCLSVLTFIAIVGFLKDSTRLRWLAAATILLSHEFNSVREYIVRDHGFWAFYLVSIWCLLHYVKNPRWTMAFAWSSSLVIATLFRVEGVIFLVLMPFIVLLTEQTFRARVQAFFKLNTLTMYISALLLLCGWFLMHGDHAVSSSPLGRLGEVQYQLVHGIQAIFERFHASAQVISQQVLSQYAAHDANSVLVLVLLSWYVLNVANNVSVIYALIVLFTWTSKLLTTAWENRRVVWGYLIINVFITFAFLVENMFLSKRYLLALSLTLMIWVPFGLDRLFKSWPQHKGIPILVALLLIAFSLGGIFDFGYSKRYIRDAGEWLDRNVSQDALIYSNDEQVMYYSHHYGNDIFMKGKEFSNINIIADAAWKHYDYVAIRMSKRKQSVSDEYLKTLGHPVKVFANKRGDEVNIYKVH